MQSKLSAVKRKSRKFCDLPVLQPAWSRRVNLSCLKIEFYISENAEWIADEFSLALGQQFNQIIGNYQIILTLTRTFEY